GGELWKAALRWARQAAAAAAAGVGRSRPVPPLKMVPLGVLTLLSIVGGFFAMPDLSGVPGAAEGARLAAPPAHEAAVAGRVLTESSAATLTIALLLAVSVIGGGLALQRFGPKRAPQTAESGFVKAAGAGFYFDDFYRAVFVRPLRATAGFVGDVTEPHVIDGAVNGVARLAATLSGAVRRVQSGYVRRYALALMAGVAVVLIYFVLMV
ncbi:MAG: hypothetical protein FWJ61_07990, partial [Limnochordales bacterium]